MHLQLCQLPTQWQHHCQCLNLRISPLEHAKVELLHPTHDLEHGLLELGCHDFIAVRAVGVGLVAVRVAAEESERL